MRVCRLSLDRGTRFNRLLESVENEPTVGSEVKRCLECGCNYIAYRECPRCSSKHTSLVGSIVESDECDEMDEFEFEEVEIYVDDIENIEEEDILNEATKKVVRDGEVVKVKVKRKKAKLTSKQKAALNKARKKSNSAAAQKKRAKSMKIRSKKLKESFDFDNCYSVAVIGGGLADLYKTMSEAAVAKFEKLNKLPKYDECTVDSHGITFYYVNKATAKKAHTILNKLSDYDDVCLVDESNGDLLAESKSINEAFDFDNSFSVTVLGGGLAELLSSMSEGEATKFFKLNKVPNPDEISVQSDGIKYYYTNKATAKKAHVALKKLADYDDVELIDESTGDLLAESKNSKGTRTMTVNENYRPELKPGIVLVSEMTKNAHIVARQLGFRATKDEDKFTRSINEYKLVLEKCSGDMKGLAVYGLDKDDNFLSESKLNSLLESVGLELN